MNVQINNKIDDLDEFSKLFKVNIPVKEHFGYYLNVLSEDNSRNIFLEVDDFIKLETFAKDNGYSSARSYKLSFAIPALVKYITESEVYKNAKNINEIQRNSIKLITKDEVKKTIGKNYSYLSFDISKANYSVLKIMDKENELKDSWEELCFSLDIHPTLVKSKSFRQIVFGNINPKMLQTLHHFQICSAVNYLKLKGLSDDNISFISHDEIVLRFNMDDPGDVYLLALYSEKETVEEITTAMGGLIVKSNLYDIKKVGKDVLLKTYYSQNKESGFTKIYSSLHGVPGNKFYKYFKLYVLEKELDDRDLYFMNDGEIAIWSTEDDSIADTMVPDGELSREEIERDYSYFINVLKNEVTGLSDAQVRKIINVVLSLCSVCNNSNKDCNCWKDE